MSPDRDVPRAVENLGAVALRILALGTLLLVLDVAFLYYQFSPDDIGLSTSLPLVVLGSGLLTALWIPVRNVADSHRTLLRATLTFVGLFVFIVAFAPRVNCLVWPDAPPALGPLGVTRLDSFLRLDAGGCGQTIDVVSVVSGAVVAGIGLWPDWPDSARDALGEAIRWQPPLLVLEALVLLLAWLWLRGYIPPPVVAAFLAVGFLLLALAALWPGGGLSTPAGIAVVAGAALIVAGLVVLQWGIRAPCDGWLGGSPIHVLGIEIWYQNPVDILDPWEFPRVDQLVLVGPRSGFGRWCTHHVHVSILLPGHLLSTAGLSRFD